MLEPKRHAERRAAPLENVEQELARHAGEAVARRGQHLAPVVDVDVVPVGEALGDLLRRLAVGLRKPLERRVGEDDAEAEGVVGPVALDDDDVVGGVRLLHEQGEIEPRRTTADADDLHASILG